MLTKDEGFVLLRFVKKRSQGQVKSRIKLS